MFQFSKRLVLFLSLLLPYSMAQSSSLNIMGDGVWEFLGNDTIRCNSTYIQSVASSSSSSYDFKTGFAGAVVGMVGTIATNKILVPLLDRLSCYQACTQKTSRMWYSGKSYIPCCRGICNPSSSKTMDLDQVISRPRKGWCCFSQTGLGDFEESLHLLDRDLGNTGWVKSPIIENDSFFRLVGFRYQQGNNWIAIIREYVNTNVEPYELHPSLQEKSTYVLQKKIEKMKSHIVGNSGAEKKYFRLDADGLEIVNGSHSQPSAILLQAGEKAQKLGSYFVESFLPTPLSGSNTEPAPVTLLRDRLQEILRSWKAEGVTIEVDSGKQYAYLQVAYPFTRSNRLSVYLHNGNREERASTAVSSSSSSASGLIDQAESFR